MVTTDLGRVCTSNGDCDGGFYNGGVASISPAAAGGRGPFTAAAAIGRPSA